MKVKELIKRLKKMDSELDVFILVKMPSYHEDSNIKDGTFNYFDAKELTVETINKHNEDVIVRVMGETAW